MDEKTQQPKEKRAFSGQRLAITVLILIVIAAVTGGALAYSEDASDDRFESLEASIDDLAGLVQELRSDSAASEEDAEEEAADEEASEEVASETCDTTCDIEVPVVVYERPGLLSAAEKAELQERLIDPFIAYKTDAEHGVTGDLLSVDVIVPADEGDEFQVTAVYSDGDEEGIIEGFLYGERGLAVQPWWYPECLDACPFSDAFSAEYPDVVDAAL